MRAARASHAVGVFVYRSTMVGIFSASIERTAARVRHGELGARDLTERLLARIARLEPTLHAHATVTAELALEQAAAVDADRARGRALGALAGVPMGLKDIISAAGAPTHVGSRALRNWRPGGEAAVARRLREAGAVLIGKHQTTEAACGAHHPTVDPPRNPWHRDAWTGVSSSGSGVAVAAALAFGAFGSDTGGSIRFPAHCCGLVGLKPSYGAIPLDGVFPLAPRFDHVGPLARSVGDAALLWAVASAGDTMAPAWRPPPGRLGLRLGYDEAWCGDDVAAPVAATLREAAAILCAAGATFVPVAIPRLGARADDWLALTACAARNAHAATYPARAADYGPALSALLDYGATLDSAAIEHAHRHVADYARQFAHVFDSADVLLSPVLHGLTPSRTEAARQMRSAGLRRFVAFTAPANLSGYPTLSLPGGHDTLGTPWCYQLVGRHGGERLLFDAAHALERARPWPLVAPDFAD